MNSSGKAMRLSRVLDALAIVLIPVALYMALLYAPAEKTMKEVQRIFYFHVPAAMMGFLGFMLVLVCSILYVAKGRRRYDAMALAGAEVGWLFTTLVLLTGPVWARSAWGAWWTWDARLSSTLVLWLIYGAYLILRSLMADDLRMRRYAAVLGIMGALNVPIVYFSVFWWTTQHPKLFIAQAEKMHPAMSLSLQVCTVAMLCLFLSLFVKRFLLEIMRIETEDLVEASRDLIEEQRR
ncbi:MAG: cytochrome c biogenesis protein CcsA [Candidatus Eisenbacteria bacterium]|uniref:Heme exporter protein C n=1 Tax=Eiseniibacteriota bacterium TaxID=2212470 RepID=A0A948RWL7_UNCEI|nr:cytochrome c biogenesis protein CcsA [Candidatus Eisenbacteria bacterium]MBU1950147.1 cytochrome c biogenesis protein CcsA [Candidatus Eisenbacteria bacterium]MBU2689599.1 cytochrome c biogenesis protein CcsA [Candidatus Eisenbacteria bacterium]